MYLLLVGFKLTTFLLTVQLFTHLANMNWKYHCTLPLCRMLSLRWWSSSISAVSSSSLTSPVKGSSTTPFMLFSNPPIFFPFNRIFPFRSYTHTNMERIHYHQQPSENSYSNRHKLLIITRKTSTRGWSNKKASLLKESINLHLN